MTDIDAYIQPAAATTWLEAHVVYFSAWTNASSTQKAAALVEASDHIDSLPLKGYKYADDATQPRAFPRIPDRAAQIIPYDSEINFQSEEDYSDVPQEVMDACCLEALEILKQGASGRATLREQGVKQYSIGGKLSETLADGPAPALLSKRAMDKMRFWMGSVAEAV